jgi:tetratricopeptide (TPR) repeat protein
MLYKPHESMKRRKRARSAGASDVGPAARAGRGAPERVASFTPAGIAIFLVAVIARLVHLWQMKDTLLFSVLMGDSRGYDAWARQIAAGDWIGHDVFYQAPLYPYFLGAIYALVGPDLFVVRLIQALVGAVACVALGYAAAHLVSRAAGLVAGLMLALYAPAIFFDGLIQKSILDILLVCFTLALIGSIVAGRDDRRSWVLLGLILGALILTRENAIVLAACVVVWAVIRQGTKLSSMAPASLVLAGLAVVLLPVALRNYAVSGGFHLTTSQLGTNLFIGNNPAADGSYVSLRPGRGSPEYERVDATALAVQATGRSLTPGEVSRYWTDRALTFIREQPADWAVLMLRKIRLLVSATEIIDTESLESHAEHSSLLAAAAVLWHFGILIPIAAVGAVMLWPERRRIGVIYAMAIAYAASVVLFFVVARYRYPLVPFLLIFGAAGVTGLRSFVDTTSRRRVLIAGIAAVVVAVVAFWPLHTAASQRAITESNLGAALQEAGRADEAIDRYLRALDLDADYQPALNNLGTALRAAGRGGEAIDVYERALTQQPEAPGLHYNLANAMMAEGRASDAIDHFRRALAINPRLVEARSNLGLALEANGRVDEAVAEWRQVLAVDERSAQAHSNLGNALVSRGSVSEGIGHLRRSIELAPGDPATHYDLGSALLEARAFDPATVALREALRLKPDYAEAHNNLGIALASQGKVDEAVGHWREALRLEPGFADARRNLELAGRNP